MKLSDLKKNISDLESKNDEPNSVTIKFETFVSEKSIFGDYKSPYVDVVDSVQFSVERGIVGYERSVIFKKLKELSEAMKEKLVKYIDNKYSSRMKKYENEYNELSKEHTELKRKVEEFNRKHLFKVKI